MYPLQLRVEVNEVSDSPYFFLGRLWQSGAGHKASSLQFMQTSALLRKASLFSQNLPINLASLFFWMENSFFVDVAEREFVVCAILNHPDLLPSMSESFRGSGRYLTWSGKSFPLPVVNGNFATDLSESWFQPWCSQSNIDGTWWKAKQCILSPKQEQTCKYSHRDKGQSCLMDLHKVMYHLNPN